MFDGILQSNSNIAAMSKAWIRSGNGTRSTEAGFLVFKDREGNIGTVNLPNTNQNKQISFNPNDLKPSGATLLAVFHTHPTTGAGALPSIGKGHDSGTSNVLGVPVYVLHQNGLSSVDPSGAITKAIRENLDWLKECKK